MASSGTIGSESASSFVNNILYYCEGIWIIDLNKKDLHKFRDFEGIFHFIDNFNTINCNCKLHLHSNFCFRRKTLLIKVHTFSFQGLLGGRKNFKQGFLMHFPPQKTKTFIPQERDHAFCTYSKLPQKLTFLNRWYAHLLILENFPYAPKIDYP